MTHSDANAAIPQALKARRQSPLHWFTVATLLLFMSCASGDMPFSVPTIADELGFGLLQAGQATKAVVQYEQAIRLKPDSAVFHLGLAKALSKLGLTNAAEAQYRLAVELNPSLAPK